MHVGKNVKYIIFMIDDRHLAKHIDIEAEKTIRQLRVREL